MKNRPSALPGRRLPLEGKLSTQLTDEADTQKAPAFAEERKAPRRTASA